MTEIPEHLLKRSRERRSALGLGGGETTGEQAAGEPAAAATTPATTEAAVPAAAAGPAPRKAAAAPAPPPPPKPDPPYVAAAKNRPRIPYWAMGALSLLPVWIFMYVRSLTAEPDEAAGPLGVGAEVYSGCSGCHGASGAGGVGYPFAEGEVLLTFPHIEDQLRYVYFGTASYNLEGVEIYGNPDREGGPHATGERGVMPGQGSLSGGSLTDDEILGVVCHERYTLGGADPDSDDYLEEFETWCAEEAPTYVALEGGMTLAELADAGLTDADGAAIEILPIGDVPIEGAPPG